MSQLVRTRIKLDPRAFAGAANANRTPGLHATDVLRDIDGMLGRLKQSANAFTQSDLEDYALQGYLWEWAMTETLRGRVVESDGAAIGLGERYTRLCEIAIRLDGSHAFFIDPTLPEELRIALTRGCLIMSPDGALGATPDECEALIECKWTTKSARMDPETDKRIWFSQVKLYLVGLSAVLGRLITNVQWHVQFAVGERWGSPSVYERWDRSYDRAEMMAAWNMTVGQIQQRAYGEVATGGGDPFGWRRWLE